jgi:hypothetical protein
MSVTRISSLSWPDGLTAIISLVVLAVSAVALSSCMPNKAQTDAPQEDIARVAALLAESEMERWADDRWDRWGAPAESASNMPIAVTYPLVMNFISAFRTISVTPPDPDVYTTYSIPSAANALAEYDGLGKQLGKVISTADQTQLDEFENVLEGIWDLLWVDFIHIALVMKQDNSRDAFWFELHKSILAKVDAAAVEIADRPRN